MGDHDQDDPMGKGQRQGLGEGKEYVAHKMASTGTYPSSYMNAVKEGGLISPPPPVVVKGGYSPPSPPIYMPLLEVIGPCNAFECRQH